jgi:hypothetical protein
MNVRRCAAVTIAVLFVAVIIIAGVPSFFSATPVNETTYVEPASALHASAHTTTTDGTIALRLNDVSDASNPLTESVWIKFNTEGWNTAGSNPDSHVYRFSLTPPPGATYLVANVTITNVGNKSIPFTYESFVLIVRDGTPYYPNYAVCSRSCSASVLLGRTLDQNFSSDLLVLFSVPAGAQPTKLAYMASNPPIVTSVT